MKHLVLLMMLLSSVAIAAPVSPAEPDAGPDPGTGVLVQPPCVPNDMRPECLFHFDPNGQVHTQDGIAERTFSFPPLKIGFIFDLHSVGLFPYGAIQVVDWWMFNQEFSVNAGLSWERAIVDYHWSIVPLLDFGPSIWAGWDFQNESFSAGLGVTILKF